MPELYGLRQPLHATPTVALITAHPLVNSQFWPGHQRGVARAAHNQSTIACVRCSIQLDVKKEKIDCIRSTACPANSFGMFDKVKVKLITVANQCVFYL